MWINDDIIYLVHGVNTKKGRFDTVYNKNSKICILASKGDAKAIGKYDQRWECVWKNWDCYRFAFIKFLQFTTNNNFLKSVPASTPTSSGGLSREETHTSRLSALATPFTPSTR